MGANQSIVKKECDVMIVGKTGNGKSSLGNSLLCHTGPGVKPFKSGSSGSSITKQCKRVRGNLKDGTLLTIVDTPGLFDTSTPNEDTVKEIVKAIALCTPGPHVILFVLSMKRITKEEIDAIDILKKLFGTEAMKHVIVVLTGKDELGKNDDPVKTVHNYITNSPDYLQLFLKESNVGNVGIANDTDSPTHYRDVNNVMRLIYKTMEQNDNKVYSQEVFAKAEQKIQEEITRREPTSTQSKSEIREVVFNCIESNVASLNESLVGRLRGAIDIAFETQESQENC